jgi:hypothetical protein
MKRRALLATTTLTVLLATATASPPANAQARYDDTPLPYHFSIRLGGFLVETFDTTVRFDSTQVPIGTVIDLEDSLDVDANAQVFRIDGDYRFNKRHRIEFEWFSVRRSGETGVKEQITIGDPETGEEIVIEPGAKVLTNWDFDVVNVVYNWSFLNTWRYELYVGGGLNVRNLKIDLTGDFDPGDGNSTEEQFDAKGLLPLPVGCIGGRWNFSKRWLARWRWQLFAIQIGDYKGTVQDSLFVIENDSSKHVGVGFGLNNFAMHVDAEAEKLRGELDDNYLGFLAYLKVYF